MTTVNVYIISLSKPDEPNGISPQAKRLFELFASPIFQTTILKLDQIPNNIKTEYKGFVEESKNELYRFILSLKDGSKSKNPILYITDTSVTDADASTVEAIVTSLLTNEWDVCYLSKWLDSCDLYSEKKQINKNGTVLVNAVNPHGLQAIMVRPDRFLIDAVTGEVSLKDGSKIMFENNVSQTLQKLISSKKLLATTVSPNLFSVDPLTIQKKEDWVKLNECRDPTRPSGEGQPELPEMSKMDNIWFWVFVGLLVLLILFLVFKNYKM
jgi:hypothetical protein